MVNGAKVTGCVQLSRFALASIPGTKRREMNSSPQNRLRAHGMYALRERDGLMVELNDYRRLYMLVDWSQGRKLAKDINEMLTPRVAPRIAPRLPPG